MRFELKAMTGQGRVESLSLHAADEAAARQELARRGYTVLRVRTQAERSLRVTRPERFPLADFSQELVVLLEAGLPLVEALDTLAEKESSTATKSLLGQIAAIIREGRPLSEALGRFPHAFSPLYVATVRASEKTSDLAQALSRYVVYHARVDTVRRRVINASIYPALLLGVGTLVSLFLMLYVVPQFSHIYEDRSASLPLLSQVLLSWGRIADGHAGIVLGILAGAVAVLACALSQASTRIALQKAAAGLPGIGERMKLYQLARFYRTVGMLLAGGIPLVPALEMCLPLLPEATRGPLAGAIRAVAEGRPLSQAMESHGLATPVALRMLAVGEHSGNMAQMMERISAFHDEQLGRWIEKFTRLFEPLLMTAIGLVIGGIVILMYMPIFEIAGSLQ